MDNDKDTDSPDPKDFSDPSPNPLKDPDLASLCDSLKKLGIQRVVVQYEGHGDSGGIEEVVYLPEGISVRPPMDDKLRDVAEEYCPDGYENNDGGYGTLTIYPVEGLAQLEHCYRYEDSEVMNTTPAELPDALKLRLASLGIIDISGNFDGSGDSGQIEQFTVVPDTITLDPALANEVDDFLLDQLSEGWENNAGAFGDFAIDVATGDVAVDAYWRVEESNAQTTSWNWRQPWPTHTITL